MQAKFFQRYVWLVNTISSSNGISKQEIDRKWAMSAINDEHESVYPTRTFLRHKEDVEEIFGIEIAYNRGSNTYSIANSGDTSRGELRQWLLNTFVVNNALIESQALHNRILTEPIPEGQRYLPIIIEAMRNNHVLEVTHGRFGQEGHTFLLEPYCLKAFKQRWYVYGRPSTHPEERRIYALDRIAGVKETDGTFKLPSGFDAEQEFEGYYGVFTDKKCEHVLVRVSGKGAPFLRTLPLHHSQREVVTTEEYAEFEYYIAPTFDFVQQLRTYGSQLEVLQPKWLREEMVEELKANLLQYKEN